MTWRELEDGGRVESPTQESESVKSCSEGADGTGLRQNDSITYVIQIRPSKTRHKCPPPPSSALHYIPSFSTVIHHLKHNVLLTYSGDELALSYAASDSGP